MADQMAEVDQEKKSVVSCGKEVSLEWAEVHKYEHAQRDVPSVEADRHQRSSNYSRHHQRPIYLTTSPRETPCRVYNNVSVIGASVGAKRDDCWRHNRCDRFRASFYRTTRGPTKVGQAVVSVINAKRGRKTVRQNYTPRAHRLSSLIVNRRGGT
jgi:hypothetical protein